MCNPLNNAIVAVASMAHLLKLSAPQCRQVNALAAALNFGRLDVVDQILS
ncbi:MAG: hypothetical protein ACI89J_002064 [Hyphomicrobiaceae bacterium]|jgi:hypothetical protein